MPMNNKTEFTLIKLQKFKRFNDLALLNIFRWKNSKDLPKFHSECTFILWIELNHWNFGKSYNLFENHIYISIERYSVLGLNTVGHFQAGCTLAQFSASQRALSLNVGTHSKYYATAGGFCGAGRGNSVSTGLACLQISNGNKTETNSHSKESHVRLANVKIKKMIKWIKWINYFIRYILKISFYYIYNIIIFFI